MNLLAKKDSSSSLLLRFSLLFSHLTSARYICYHPTTFVALTCYQLGGLCGMIPDTSWVSDTLSYLEDSSRSAFQIWSFSTRHLYYLQSSIFGPLTQSPSDMTSGLMTDEHFSMRPLQRYNDLITMTLSDRTVAEKVLSHSTRIWNLGDSRRTWNLVWKARWDPFGPKWPPSSSSLENW